MKTETIEYKASNGKVEAFAAIPDESNGKGVILIQEYWGLNDHIKDIATRYADEGFVAIAPDLYRGKLANDPKTAAQYMSDLQTDDGLDIIAATIAQGNGRHGISHYGITGYCMGGTYALRAACMLEGISSAVPFYGDIPEEEVLKNLTAPTLFISGLRDAWIDHEKVATLEDVAERYELPVESLKYDADHAFFNDTRPEVYDPNAAADAWAAAIAHFYKY